MAWNDAAPRSKQDRGARTTREENIRELSDTRSANIGYKDYRDCLLCGGDGDLVSEFTDKRDRFGYPADPRWLYVCNHCGGGKDFLRALGESAGEDWRDLLDGPPDWLGEPRSTSHGRRRASSVERPGAASLAGWRDRRLADREALRYLRRERGLSVRTIREAGLGYGTARGHGLPWGEVPAFVIPVSDGNGQLVTVRRRFWPETPTSGGKTVKYVSPPGSSAALYPFPPTRSAAILTGGEFDALLLGQHARRGKLAVSVVSTTCGANLPADLTETFGGRRVAVIFDGGEEDNAERAVSALNRAGAEAWAVDLRLGPRSDVTDWFVREGRSLDELRRLIRRARVSD